MSSDFFDICNAMNLETDILYLINVTSVMSILFYVYTKVVDLIQRVLHCRI